MFQNYLKTSLRNLGRNKTFSAINIAGLTVGMTACLLILQYVFFELSFDRFHEQREHIYRVICEYVRNGERIFNSAENFAGVGPALQRELPKVEAFARLYNAGAKYTCMMTYSPDSGPGRSFKEGNLFFADAAFLSMFTFPMKEGSSETALREPNTAVISETASRKYFGAASPLGKILQLNDDAGHEERFTVTGVFRDVPANSHLQFDFLLSFKSLYQRSGGLARFEESWVGRDNFYTYIRLKDGTAPDQISARFPAIIDQYKPGYMETDDAGRRIRRNIFTLQPLTDIHLHSQLQHESAIPGNAAIVSFLLIIAILIIVIAWVNYINLSTARSVERASEIGVRKVVGAQRLQLIKQFLFESFLVTLIATLVAIGLVELLQPFFTLLSGVPGPTSLWSQPELGLAVAGLMLGTSVVAGLYPALLLSSFQPINILKTGLMPGAGQPLFRKALVVLQFVIALTGVAGTLAVRKQLAFMQDRDLGFSPQQVLFVQHPIPVGQSSPPAGKRQMIDFKRELLRYPGILHVAASNTIPGNEVETGLAVSRRRTDNLDEVHSIPQIFIDEDFVATYQMKLLSGRTFSPDLASEDSTVIINEAALAQLGFRNADQALGQDIFLFTARRHRIIGILQDYHHESLRKLYSPAIFRHLNNQRSLDARYLSVKLATDGLPGSLQYLEKKWQEFFPGNPFSYAFLDHHFERQYETDRRFGKIFTFFSALAIFVACLGLLSLTMLTAGQRRKEVGVRKVLGANTWQVIYLLSKDLSVLVLTATVFALPIIYLSIENWLRSFAFRIELSWDLFLLPCLLTFALAVVTMSMQTLRASGANPADILRHE